MQRINNTVHAGRTNTRICPYFYVLSIPFINGFTLPLGRAGVGLSRGGAVSQGLHPHFITPASLSLFSIVRLMS